MSTVNDNVRVTRGLTERWLREILAEPAGAIMTLAVRPLVWYVLFGGLFAAISEIPGFPADNYRAFILPGVIALMSLEFISIGGQCIINDIQEGFLKKMWSAPISKLAVVSGRLITMGVMNAIQVLVVLAIAYIDGVRFAAGPSGLALVLAMSLLLTAATSAFSLFLAYSVQHEFTFSVVASFFILPMIFLSNAFLPLDMMPDWLATVAQYSPLTVAIDGMRTLIIDGFVMDEILPVFALLVAFVVVTSVGASISFKRSIDRD